MTTMNATELAKALESNNIFSRNGFSREEYIDELLQVVHNGQNPVCRTYSAGCND